MINVLQDPDTEWLLMDSTVIRADLDHLLASFKVGAATPALPAAKTPKPQPLQLRHLDLG